MIDIKREKLVTLRQAVELLPARRAGKAPSYRTVIRWAKQGILGVRLETLRVGETLCTSHEAMQRFFEACTAADPPVREAPDPKRQRQYDQALAKLRSRGLNV